VHHDFWHERWATGQIGFHQSSVHPMLERWWSSISPGPGSRVYVPLCGRSLDMAWLARQGHRIVGSELSAIAIRDFFDEHGLEPAHTTGGRFVRHAAGPYELLEGDALELTPEVLGPVEAAYDRAALVALPPDMRPRYAESMARLLTPGARALLIAFEYPQELRGGPPFSVEPREVRALFEPAFDVAELERIDVLAENPKFAELGIPALHEIAYGLERR
jgi:thiopurine S-methyltransferase